jgi:hypothetical protein
MDHTDEAPITDDALDRQLDAAFEVQPSPEFLARIRGRVATEAMRPAWQMGWPPVAWGAGGLSLAAAALLAARLWAPSGDVTPSPVDHAIATPTVVAGDTVRPELPAVSDVTGLVAAQVPRRGRMVSGSRRLTGAEREPGVLIAADEAAALRDLFANFSEGRIAASMSPEAPAAPAMLAPILVIEVAPISMEPLAPIEALGAF